MKDGYVPTYTEYPAAVALFTSGEAAMMINGVWEVPTMTDLAEQGKLLRLGRGRDPGDLRPPCTYADCHSFAIPNNDGKEMTPEKRAAVLEVITWMDEALAVLGDRRPHPGLQAGDRLAPSTRRCSRTRPTPADRQHGLRSEVEVAGVASPIFDAAGNDFTAAVNGEVDPADAVDEIKEELDALK